MNPFNTYLFFNGILKCFVAFCITWAAVQFESPAVLWWYLILLGLNIDITSFSKKETKKDAN